MVKLFQKPVSKNLKKEKIQKLSKVKKNVVKEKKLSREIVKGEFSEEDQGDGSKKSKIQVEKVSGAKVSSNKVKPDKFVSKNTSKSRNGNEEIPKNSKKVISKSFAAGGTQENKGLEADKNTEINASASETDKKQGKKAKKLKKAVENVDTAKKVKKFIKPEELPSKVPKDIDDVDTGKIKKVLKKNASEIKTKPVLTSKVKSAKSKKAAKNATAIPSTLGEEDKKPTASNKIVEEKRKGNVQKQLDKSIEVITDEKSNQMFDAPPFDEDKFNKILIYENVEKIVKGLIATVEKETQNKKEIFTDYRYILDVCCHKISNCPKRMVKLTLKHPIAKQNEDDIVLIVRDLQRGKKVDHEPTIQHYEDLLRKHNIDGIKVISFNQLKNEFSGFENKRKLGNSYEHFLCDGRIVSHVVGFLGSITKKARATPHAVRMNEHSNIAGSIKKALRRTAFRQLFKGSTFSIPVASHRHTPEEVTENILAVVKQLKDVFPGGLPNIRSFHIKVNLLGTSSIPLFISMAQGPDSNPYIIGPREQNMLKLKRETKNVLTKFQFTNEGTIKRLTQEQIAKKRKGEEGKAREAVSEEIAAKKMKKGKVNKIKEAVENTKKEHIEELVRLEHEDSSYDDDSITLVNESEDFE